jgi:hypothetical protein
MNRTRSHLVPLFAAALALYGCGGQDDTSGNQDSIECSVTIRSTFPTDGTDDFFYRNTLEFQLSEVDATNPVAFLSQGDTDVPGTTWYSIDDKTIFFTPDAPLVPLTDYTAALDYCAGTGSVDFTTSELGPQVTEDLTGRTYVLDLFNARFTEPMIFNQVLETIMTKRVLIGVTGLSDGTLDMMLAVSPVDADPPAQDFCKKTVAVSGGADFSEDPFFSIGPTDMTFDIADGTITINNLEFSGAFASDGSYFGGGVLRGQADAREIAATNAIEKFRGMSGHDICDYLKNTIGVLCDSCASDEQPYCLDIKADSINAPELPGTTLQVVDQVNCNELCPNNDMDCKL